MPWLNALEQLGLKDLPLLQQFQLMKFGTLRAAEVTGSHVASICKAVGWSMSQSTCEALAGQVSCGNADTLADWLTEPGNFEHVKTALGSQFNKAKQALIAQCPWCSGSFMVTDDNSAHEHPDQAASGHFFMQCPLCSSTFL
jgi:hypothetical protein